MTAQFPFWSRMSHQIFGLKFLDLENINHITSVLWNSADITSRLAHLQAPSSPSSEKGGNVLPALKTCVCLWLFQSYSMVKCIISMSP